VGFFEWEQHPTEGRIRRMGVPTSWSDSPPKPGGHAPHLGENSREVLREAGYSDVDIDALLAKGVTAEPGR